MKTLFTLFFIGFLSFSYAQEKDKVDKVTVTIEPYMHTTNGAFHSFLALTCSDRAVEYIEGFKYEWGYSYKLELKRTKLAHPMEDAGDTDYNLIKVISKKIVSDSTTFTMNLKGWVQLSPNLNDDNGAFQFHDNNTCTYLGKMTFYYKKGFKDKLNSLNKSNGYKKGVFMFLKGKIYLVSL